MIEKMKKVTVLSEGSRRKELLSRLREAGVMHISDIVQKAPSAAPREEERAEYQRILQVLSERRDKKNRSRTLVTGAAFDGVHPGIKEAVDSEAALKDRIIALQNERERIIPFGDFDPDDVRKLAEDGVRLSFYTIGKKELGMLREDESVSFIPVSMERRCKRRCASRSETARRSIKRTFASCKRDSSSSFLSRRGRTVSAPVAASMRTVSQSWARPMGLKRGTKLPQKPDGDSPEHVW